MRRKIFFILLLIVAASFLTHRTCLNNFFTNWDDQVLVTENPNITDLSLQHLKRFFIPSRSNAYDFIPITMLTFTIEHHFSGLNPFIYHLDNLLLHVGNTALVFWLIFSLSRSLPVAIITATLFGIHPLHVESIAWVSARKDVLFTFFYLAALIAYTASVTSPATKAKHKKSLYVIALILFLFSLLSKVAATTLPFVLLIIDKFLARPVTRKTILEKIPFFFLSFLLLLIGFLFSPMWGNKYTVLPFAEKFLFASFSVPLYLVKILWPYELCAFYPYPFLSDGSLQLIIYLSPLVLALMFLGTVLAGRIKKDIFFGLSFFLITILAMTQLFTTSDFFIADHYAYLPSIGILFLLARWIDSLLSRLGKFQKHSKLAGMVILAGYLTSFAVLSAQRTLFWKDGISLWSDVIEKYPRVATAYLNRGTNFLSQDQFQPALDDLNKAIALDPSEVRGYNNRGILYTRAGQEELALADYNKAIGIDPLFAKTYNNRGLLYYRQKKFDLALLDFTKAVELNPSYALSYINRGNTYRALGQYALAIEEYNQALAIVPNNALALADRDKTYKLFRNRGNSKEESVGQKNE